MDDLQTLINCVNSSPGVVAYVGRTHILWRGVESLLSRFIVIPTSEAGVALCQYASIPYCLPEHAHSRFSDVPLRLLAFDSTAVPQAIMALPGCQLLASDPALVRELENKLSLPLLLERAGLQAIPNKFVASPISADAEAIWETLGKKPLVIQTPLNNLTGRGTFLVTSKDDLRSAIQKLPLGPFKAVQFIDAPSYTISSCVTSDTCLVSYPSKQLVGIKHLTNWWAAHCGNELLAEDDLSPTASKKLFETCLQLGKVLCSIGFRGHFGLDVLLVDDLPFVVEINPRVQSVSSLVHAAELKARQTPLHLLHILELSSGVHVRLAWEQHRASKWQYSQVIVSHLTGDTVVSGKLLPGCYRLSQGVLNLQDVRVSLPELTASSDFLITPFCWPGNQLQTGDRIAVVQRCGAMTDASGQLLPEVDAVVSLVRSAFVGD
jgi:hypothetical protein